MKYYVTVTHYSTRGRREAIDAKSLREAKAKATRLHGGGFVGHLIKLIELPDDYDIYRCNDVPYYGKVIGGKKWQLIDA